MHAGLIRSPGGILERAVLSRRRSR